MFDFKVTGAGKQRTLTLSLRHNLDTLLENLVQVESGDNESDDNIRIFPFDLPIIIVNTEHDEFDVSSTIRNDPKGPFPALPMAYFGSDIHLKKQKAISGKIFVQNLAATDEVVLTQSGEQLLTDFTFAQTHEGLERGRLTTVIFEGTTPNVDEDTDLQLAISVKGKNSVIDVLHYQIRRDRFAPEVVEIRGLHVVLGDEASIALEIKDVDDNIDPSSAYLDLVVGVNPVTGSFELQRYEAQVDANNHNVLVFKLPVLESGQHRFFGAVSDTDGIRTRFYEVITVAENQPPVIQSIEISDDVIIVDQGFTLTATASDPEGEALTYKWRQKLGPSAVFSSSNRASTQVEGLPSGQYVFELEVTDPRERKKTESVLINVVENQMLTVTARVNIAQPTENDSVTLNSQLSDVDGEVISIQWQQTTGPRVDLSAQAFSPSLELGQLVAGDYTFELTARDNSDATASTTVTFTVTANQRPTVTARVNIAQPNADDTIVLISQVSDSDGELEDVRWAQRSGPDVDLSALRYTPSLTLGQLVAGDYTFELTARDNSDATASTTVTFTVTANQRPTVTARVNIAQPNADDTIVLISQVSDSDGELEDVRWVQRSGPDVDLLALDYAPSLTLGQLVAGDYTFELTARDNRDATASAAVTFTVTANQGPTVIANQKPTVTARVNIAQPNADDTIVLISEVSDSDGELEDVRWVQRSGPDVDLLALDYAPSLTLGQLVAGDYTFELTARDNRDATASAAVTFTVTANQGPTVIANQKPTVTARVNIAQPNADDTIVLISEVSDSDGELEDVRWAQRSGPDVDLSVLRYTPSLTLGQLEAGDYTFELTARDNRDATASATVTFTVTANQRPTVTARVNIAQPNADDTIVLISQVSDSDGELEDIRWAQRSGPDVDLSILNYVPSLTLGQLEAGDYTFELTARDNRDATTSATVTFTVTANQRPTVTARVNIAQPNADDTIVLISEVSDSDGELEDIRWAQQSGPHVDLLALDYAPSLTLGQLAVGDYTFELTARDNLDATASTTVSFTVLASNSVPQQNGTSSQSGGGSLSWWVLIGLLGVMVVEKRNRGAKNFALTLGR